MGDPAALVGHILTAARFQGEPISPRRLGPGVRLQSDERAVAVRVKRERRTGNGASGPCIVRAGWQFHLILFIISQPYPEQIVKVLLSFFAVFRLSGRQLHKSCASSFIISVIIGPQTTYTK